MRIGMGYDVHRLVEGRDLILGGVKIEYEKGLLGHSDADVLLHAIMDALLGAAALGDIGKQRNGCKNYIGACAEPHAARTVMMSCNVNDVKDLAFSYAYRPRTKSVLRYCRNCTDIFEVVNP